MKKIDFKLQLLIFVLISLVVFNACKKDEDPEPTPNVSASSIEAINDQETKLPNLDLLISPEISLATLDNDMTILSDGILTDEDLETDESYIAKRGRYYRLFAYLELTEEQKIKFKRVIAQYNRCRKTQLMQLRRINHEIISRGNLERAELIRKYKAGLLTKRELNAAMNTLNARIKNAIMNNPHRLRIIESLKGCYRVYMDNVRLILTREQLQKWIALHKRGKGTGNGGRL